MTIARRSRGCVALLSAISFASATGQGARLEWHFKVLADGRPIGTHDFRVTNSTEQVLIETSAHFRVSAAFIPLFHYDHEDRESWESGCLKQIDADTNDDGKQYHVHGHASERGFSMDTPPPGSVLQGCIQTFAYWDKRFLEQRRLLNAQTGEYTDVTVVHRGREPVTVGGKQTDSDHYTLSARKLTVDLWYSSEGDWLALESLTENGHRLKYERQ